MLRVKEAGATVAEVLLKPVTDSIHVISTGDQTGIFLSVAAGLSDSCDPMVMHAGGPLISPAAPAKPGDCM